jgi:spermidine synthase
MKHYRLYELEEYREIRLNNVYASTKDGYIGFGSKDETSYINVIIDTVNPTFEGVVSDQGYDLVNYEDVECGISSRSFEYCKDPTLSIRYRDLTGYSENKYDIIIVDSTDPFGPGEGLFTKEFYGSCNKALRADGIMVNQHESPFYDEDAAAMQRSHKRIVESFPISRVYQAHIPTYPSGHWLFGFASKKYHPVHDLNGIKWNMLGLKTKYYNSKLHVGAFALPNYVEEMLRDVE